VFIKAEIGGKLVSCLLDTGCERSVIGRNIIPNAELTDTYITLFAANGTEIPLIGAVNLKFTIGNLPVFANLVVTEALEELILRIGWLSSNDCQWDLKLAKLTLNGSIMSLHHRLTISAVRRMYTGKDFTIPPTCQVNLPVSLTWGNLRAPKTDWVVEPKTSRPRVVLARTLI
jgi:hypothetical protein